MHLNDDELVLHYYGETGEREDARLVEHLAGCAACQRTYRRLQQVMAAIDQSATAAFEAPDGFERTAWARLAPNLGHPVTGWRSWLTVTPGRLGWAAAIVLLVTGAFLAGRLLPGRPAPAQASAAVGDVREGVLLVDLSDHLERSQMVLIELVSSDGRGAIDVSAERARAQDLVAAGRLYRQTAAETGDTRLVDVLDQLERVLVDVAASPAEISGADLDAVRQRIESGGLLFKVRVVSSDLRARQKTVLQKRTASEL